MVSRERIFQDRFFEFRLLPDLTEAIILHQVPQEILSKPGWRRVFLSSIPKLPGVINTIELGKPVPENTEEEIIRMITGSALHKLYSLAVFLTLSGVPETAQSHFPTLKVDSPELAWIRGTLADTVGLFRTDPGLALEQLWSRVAEKTGQEIKEKLPLLLPPATTLALDGVYQRWEKEEADQKATSLINLLLHLERVRPYELESVADQFYFELGFICFIPELKWTLVGRLDELVSARARGRRRQVSVVDFKSGRKQASFGEADLAYHLLMQMIGERLALKYLNRGGIPAGSEYLQLGIYNFSAESSATRSSAIFRYVEGEQNFHQPFEWAAPGKRAEVLPMLQAWDEKMKKLNLVSV